MDPRISIDTLMGLRRVYAHTNAEGPCADGLAAAMLVRDVLPDVELHFVVLNTNEHEEMEPVPGTLVLDMTPPADRVLDFVREGAVVLDHHDKQRPIVERFGPRGVFGERGVSGATLAFRHVWLPLKLEAQRIASGSGVLADILDGERARQAEYAQQFAGLIAIRDTWQTDHVLYARARELSSTIIMFDDWLTDGSPLDRERIDRRVATVGAQLVRAFDAEARRSAEGAWRFTTSRGTRVAVLHSMRARSDAADLVKDCDLVVAFEYRTRPRPDYPTLPHGVQMKLSFRARTEWIHCGRLAGTFGANGGGHAGAAGCVVDFGAKSRLSEGGNPWAFIQSVLEEPERLGLV